jgi:tryptophanyl-tRNA synthetase
VLIDERGLAEVVGDFDGMGKAELKRRVADAVVEELAPVRERFAVLMREGNVEAREAYEVGSRRAARKAEETMVLVREAVGLKELQW